MNTFIWFRGRIFKSFVFALRREILKSFIIQSTYINWNVFSKNVLCIQSMLSTDIFCQYEQNDAHEKIIRPFWSIMYHLLVTKNSYKFHKISENILKSILSGDDTLFAC